MLNFRVRTGSSVFIESWPTTKIIVCSKARRAALSVDTQIVLEILCQTLEPMFKSSLGTKYYWEHITKIRARSQQIAEQSLLSCLQCPLSSKSSAKDVSLQTYRFLFSPSGDLLVNTLYSLTNNVWSGVYLCHQHRFGLRGVQSFPSRC